MREEPAVSYRPCTPDDFDEWAALRHALWPHETLAELRSGLEGLLARDAVAFIARDGARKAIGFAEATLRHDYVNGCETSPVVFLEGIYVEPAHRLRGIARTLTEHVERWGRERGCTEFASDALADNAEAHKMHEALGLRETERVVYFRKKL